MSGKSQTGFYHCPVLPWLLGKQHALPPTQLVCFYLQSEWWPSNGVLSIHLGTAICKPSSSLLFSWELFIGHCPRGSRPSSSSGGSRVSPRKKETPCLYLSLHSEAAWSCVNHLRTITELFWASAANPVRCFFSISVGRMGFKVLRSVYVLQSQK